MSVDNNLVQIKPHFGETEGITDYADLDGVGTESDIFSEEEIRILLADVLGLIESNPEIDIIIDALKEDQGITGSAQLTMDPTALSDFLDIDDDTIIDETDIATTGEEGIIKHIIALGDGVDENDITGATQIKSLNNKEKMVVIDTLKGMVNNKVTEEQVDIFFRHASKEGWTLEGVFNRLDGQVGDAEVAKTYEYTVGNLTSEGVVGDDDISSAEASYAILEILGENNGTITRTPKEDPKIDLDITHFEGATDAKGHLHKSGLQDILVDDYNFPATIAEKITDNIFAGIKEDWSRMSPEKLLNIVDFDNSGSLSRSEFAHFIDNKNTEETLDTHNVDQAGYGNCWFLSGMMAIGNTEEGQQAIDRSITQKENGDYVVTFPADPDRSYTVKQSDLDGDEYKMLSKDNVLMKVLEIAAEKFDDANEDFFEGDNLVEGGSANRIGRLYNIDTKILHTYDGETKEGDITNALIDYANNNPDNIALTFSASSVPGQMKPYNEGTGAQSGHVWTITDIDTSGEGLVTFVNPHDSSETLTATFKEFEKYKPTSIGSFDV